MRYSVYVGAESPEINKDLAPQGRRNIMEYFGSVQTIEQLKAEYLAYLRKWKGSAIRLAT